MIEPVEFWDSADSSDQQLLTAYFYSKLKEDLQKGVHYSRSTGAERDGFARCANQCAEHHAGRRLPRLRLHGVALYLPPNFSGDGELTARDGRRRAWSSRLPMYLLGSYRKKVSFTHFSLQIRFV